MLSPEIHEKLRPMQAKVNAEGTPPWEKYELEQEIKRIIGQEVDAQMKAEKAERQAAIEKMKERHALRKALENRTGRNAFYAQAKAAAQNAINQFGVLKKQLAELEEKQKSGRVGETDYKEMHEKIRSKVLSVQSDAETVINKAFTDFENLIKKFETPNPKMMCSATVDMLKMSKISEEHLTQLAADFANNPTMLGVFEKYAEDKGYKKDGLPRTDGKYKIAEFEKIINHIRWAVGSGLDDTGYARKSFLDADSHEINIKQSREAIGDVDAIAAAVGMKLKFTESGEWYE